MQISVKSQVISNSYEITQIIYVCRECLYVNVAELIPRNNCIKFTRNVLKYAFHLDLQMVKFPRLFKAFIVSKSVSDWFLVSEEKLLATNFDEFNNAFDSAFKNIFYL